MADGTIRVSTKLDNTQLKKEIRELERELNNISKEQAKVEAEAAKVRDSYAAEREFDAQFPEEFSHREDIDKRAAAEMDKINQKQAELNQKEREHLALLESKKAKLTEQQAIQAASKELDASMAGNSAASKITSQAQYNSLLDATVAKMQAMEIEAERIAAKTGVAKDEILKANPAYQKLVNTMKMLQAQTGKFGSEAAGAGKKAEHAMKKARAEADKLTKSTRHGIMGFGKMQLAMMGIMFAMRAISSATQEYMAVNTELEGQMNTLKALWGQVLGPVIQWVINLLIQAVTAVNSFVYALTGINYVARANEAALKKQALATNSAKKAAQLAGFDEQTKLTDTSSSAADKNPVTLLDETVGALSGFAEKLKEQILAGDWYGAGKTAGQWLMDGIKGIDWEGVGTTIGAVVGGAIGFALGFAVSIDPLTLLEAGVKLVTGLFNSLAQAVQNVDWSEVGGKIIDLLLLSLVWSVVQANPILMILALMLTPGGDELVKSAAEFAGSLVGALVAAVVGMVKRLGEISKFIFDTIKTWLDENVDWSGTPEEIVGQLFAGLITALKGVGTWIYNNIWVPFRDGFQKAFGINSPSTKMKEFGGYVIDGLKNGITNGISKLKQAAKDALSAILGVFSTVGTRLKNIFSDAWQKVKDVFSKGGKIFSGIKDGIASTFKSIVNTLISGINTIIATPFRSINNMLNTIRSTKVLGIQPFKSLWDYNPLSIPQIPKLALGGIVNRPGRGVPAIIGEAGAEAVLPLENNTEWMDMLAEKIGGNVTIPIYLDGRKMYTYFVDIGKRKAFAANGG